MEEWDDNVVTKSIEDDSEPEDEIQFANTSSSAAAMVRWLTLFVDLANCVPFATLSFILAIWIHVHCVRCPWPFQ